MNCVLFIYKTIKFALRTFIGLENSKLKISKRSDMNIKKLLLYSFVITMIISINGCKNTASMEAANKAYDLYQFSDAIGIYKKVIKKEKK